MTFLRGCHPFLAGRQGLSPLIGADLPAPWANGESTRPKSLAAVGGRGAKRCLFLDHGSSDNAFLHKSLEGQDSKPRLSQPNKEPGLVPRHEEPQCHGRRHRRCALSLSLHVLVQPFVAFIHPSGLLSPLRVLAEEVLVSQESISTETDPCRRTPMQSSTVARIVSSWRLGLLPLD